MAPLCLYAHSLVNLWETNSRVQNGVPFKTLITILVENIILIAAWTLCSPQQRLLTWYSLLSLVSLTKLRWNLWSCVMRVEGVTRNHGHKAGRCRLYWQHRHTHTTRIFTSLCSVSSLLFRALFRWAWLIRPPVTTRPTWLRKWGCTEASWVLIVGKGRHKLLVSYPKCHSIPTSSCQACPLELLSKSNHMFHPRKYSKATGSAIAKSTYQSTPMPIILWRRVISSVKEHVPSILTSIAWLACTFLTIQLRHLLSSEALISCHIILSNL